MKVDTMRKVDYLAGIPLCFLATGLVRLVDLFVRRRTVTVTKALLVELSEMGSAILADPAMRRLRRDAGAELYFAIFADNAPSLRLLNTVPTANVFTIRNDSFFSLAIDSLRFLVWARRRGIDTVIDLELFSRYSALLTGLSGASNRVGFHAFHNEGLYRGEMLTRRVAFNPHIHIAKNFIALTNAALAAHEELPFSKTLIDDSELRLTQAAVAPQALAVMDGRIQDAYPAYRSSRHRIVLINPNASDLLPQRRWMPEHFIAVMEDLLNRYDDLLILITGSSGESRLAETLRRQIDHRRCINFCGRVELTELPALYRIATLMLTNDSGPGHFSAVTALRTFVLFGPETPRLYGSLGNSTALYAGLACSPCVSAWNHRKTPCRDNVCLRTITPEQVLARLHAALDCSSTPSSRPSGARDEQRL
jgi:ADP-heptose:LPS heptosyltransferase